MSMRGGDAALRHDRADPFRRQVDDPDQQLAGQLVRGVQDGDLGVGRHSRSSRAVVAQGVVLGEPHGPSPARSWRRIGRAGDRRATCAWLPGTACGEDEDYVTDPIPVAFDASGIHVVV
jgi:hypothetical protein